MKTAAQELVTRKEAQGRVVEEMRRRRVTMALAASLLIGVIGSGWFAFHAGKQGRLAEKERKLADSAREEAEVSEQTTSVALDKASTLNTELTKSKENQRRMLYGAQMNLVQNAWGVDDVPQVQKLLNATRQRPGETDLRGIEWHYWQRMLHQEERVFKLPLWLSAGSALPQLNELPPGSKLSDGAAARTTFSHDGRRLAVIAAHVEDSQLVEVLKVWNTESNSVEPIFSWNLPRNSGFALFAGGKKVTEAIGGTMTSPIVSCRIVFLDAKRVVIATPASKSSEDSRMLDILERRANAAGQEKKELDKERALLSNENLATLELQTFRLDSTLDAQLAQAHPPIKVQEGFAFNRDGARIATHAVIFNEGESRLQSSILILDGRTGEQIDQLPSPFPHARVLALSPDAARMVVAESILNFFGRPVTARDIEITILERATLNSNSVPLRDYNKGAPRFAFSPDGTRLAVDLGLGVQKLAILDASTGRELFSISNDASSVTSRRPLETFGSKSGDFVAFSPDGKWLVSRAASIDRATNVLKVWEAATGKLGTEFKGNTSRTIQAAFSADSKQLYVADQSGSIKVWRLPTKTVSELNENAARPLAVQNGEVLPAARITARSSDGRWTASAPASSYYAINQGGGGPSANRSTSPGEPPFEIKLEDTSGRVPPQTLPLSGPAERLTFSPDGSFLESISVDESAKLDEAVELKVWSVATGKLAILPALRFRATDKAVNMRIVSTLLQPFVQSETKPHSSDLSLFSPDSQRLVCVFAPSGTAREGAIPFCAEC